MDRTRLDSRDDELQQSRPQYAHQLLIAGGRCSNLHSQRTSRPGRIQSRARGSSPSLRQRAASSSCCRRTNFPESDEPASTSWIPASDLRRQAANSSAVASSSSARGDDCVAKELRLLPAPRVSPQQAVQRSSQLHPMTRHLPRSTRCRAGLVAEARWARRAMAAVVALPMGPTAALAASETTARAVAVRAAARRRAL